MKKILIGVAILAVGAVVVFGARKGLREHARATPQVVGSAARTQAEPQLAVGVPAPAPAGDHGAAAVVEDARQVDASATTVDPEPAPVADQVVPRGASKPAAPASPGSDAETTSSIEPAVQQPDVAQVLRRAASAYTKANTLQADFSQRSTNPILRKTVTSSGTLYQRRPDRFLMKFTDPAGDVIVSDGTYFWVYYPSVDRKQVIRMPASGGAGGVDLQAQFVGDPVARFAAEYEGREAVAGRDAYVLVLTPREPMGYRRLKVWIDAQDYLVRRFEVTEESGVVRYFELSNLKVNPTLSNDLFRFTQPEGTHIVDRG